MKLLAIVFFVLAPASWAGVADPSFRFEALELRRETPLSCQATRVVTGKSDKCFAVTASECLTEENAESGQTKIRSRELGVKLVTYYRAPGGAALLSWKCEGDEINLPYFFLFSDLKVRPKEPLDVGHKAMNPDEPRQLVSATAGRGSRLLREISLKGTKLSPDDKGAPVICANGSEDLCGVIVAPEKSQAAAEEALAFMKAKMRELGVKEYKVTFAKGRRVVLVQE